MKNFLGQDGFIWWIGVVEDVLDPNRLGRVKVRCYGYHPKKQLDSNGNEIPELAVPSSDLPWAIPIHPINTPNLYGAPNVGDWVFGFFLDGQNAQEPAILGYFPGIPQRANDYFGSQPRKYFSPISGQEDGKTGSLIRNFNLFSSYTRVNDPGFDIANTMIWQSRSEAHTADRTGHFLLFYDKPKSEVVLLRSSSGHEMRMNDNNSASGADLQSNRFYRLMSSENREILLDDRIDRNARIDIRKIKITSNTGVGSHYLLFSDSRTPTDNVYVQLASSKGHKLTFNDIQTPDEREITLESIRGHSIVMTDISSEEKIKIETIDGHKLEFKDEALGDEIAITHRNGSLAKITKDEIVIEHKTGSKFVIDVNGNITVTATAKDFTVNAGTINLNATGNVDINGANIYLN